MKTCNTFLNLVNVTNMETALRTYEHEILFVMAGEKGCLNEFTTLQGAIIAFFFKDRSAMMFGIPGDQAFSLTDEEEIGILTMAIAKNKDKFIKIPLDSLMVTLNEQEE